MAVTPERWQRIEQLYHSALERTPGDRAAYLAAECAGDEDFRREVESLINDGQERAFLDRPAMEVAAEQFVSAVASDLVGRTLGRYEIIARIGAGGMGEIYRARDLRLRREVAIKTLPPAFAIDRDRLARFEREAHVLASMNHPNVAAIYGFEDADGVYALVMELVDGPTLAERIHGRAMSMDEALPIARQIADGLEYAHERGIVHRDLKPSNVKLTAEGAVKILDFGLAKALENPATSGDPPPSPTLMKGTRSGLILGTAAYMSPEQARGAVVDKRADIWAYGVVLYEMLTGRPPFGGETVSDTLASVLKTEPDWDALPAGVRRLVRRCLEKDPKQRLRDIGDARLELESETGVALQPRPKRRLPWTVAAMLGAIATLALAGWWRSTRPEGHPLMRLKVELPEFALSDTGPSAILSPNGTRVVYIGGFPAPPRRESWVGSNGKSSLYTRTLDQDDAALLVGTEGAYSPFFSPDGQSVGFFADGKLKKILIQGGGATVLCDAPEGHGASWGEDGNIIAALQPNSGLSRIPSGGGTEQPVTELRKEFTHRWPQVLPGAQAVLFTAHRYYRDFNDASIEVQSLRSGERKTLVRGGYYGRMAPSGHLLYVRQGTLYAAPMDLKRLVLTGPAAPVVQEMTASAAGQPPDMDFSSTGTLLYVRGEGPKHKLVWLDGAGRTHPLRSTAAEYEYLFRISPEGKRVAMSVVEGGTTDLWVYDWERDTMTRLTFAPGADSAPVWSPDGKHIAFTSARHGGTPNLYWMRADGAGDAVRLAESDHIQIPYSFSPDGKRLAFHEITPDTEADLWTVPMQEPTSDDPKPGKPEPFLVTKFVERAPMFSPDGRWLAYTTNESGAIQVYVRRFPGPGAKSQVSTAGGFRPVWSHKQPELFYGTDQGIMVASYTISGETFVVGKPRLWAEKKGLMYFDLAPDGKRFVVQEEADRPKAPPPVTFLLNFFDELRRRAPAGN